MIVEVPIDKVIPRVKDKRYAIRHEHVTKGIWYDVFCYWLQNGEAKTRKKYPFVFKPIDVVCITKAGSRAFYPDCYFYIVDGRHRYHTQKRIECETIKVRFINS